MDHDFFLDVAAPKGAVLLKVPPPLFGTGAAMITLLQNEARNLVNFKLSGFYLVIISNMVLTIMFKVKNKHCLGKQTS